LHCINNSGLIINEACKKHAGGLQILHCDFCWPTHVEVEYGGQQQTGEWLGKNYNRFNVGTLSVWLRVFWVLIFVFIFFGCSALSPKALNITE